MQYQDTLFFLFSLFLALSLTPFIIMFAKRFQIMDIPFGSLKVHKTPTPYLGGLLIYLSFFVTLACLLRGDYALYLKEITLLFIGLTGFLFVGLYDDIFISTPLQKFTGQICSALILLYAGHSMKPYFFSNYFFLGIALFIILSLVNAFNLVDVMDGLATTLALSSTCMFLLIAYLQQAYTLVFVLSAFAGALLGFLFWNKPAAKIYLGDAGALFLGAFLSVAPFFLSWSWVTTLGYFTPLTFMSVPLLEVTFLIFIRLLLSIRPWHGSPHHFSILLQKKGWSKKKILCWAFAINTLFSLVGIGFLQGYYSFIYFVLGISLLLLYWVFVVFNKALFLLEICKQNSFCKPLNN